MPLLFRGQAYRQFIHLT